MRIRGFLLLLLVPATLRSQDINVIANAGMRPTAILGPHVRYVVAADSLQGGALIRDVSIGPVAFAGEIRVHGAHPGEGVGAGGFPDTVRFEQDGRVLLRIADQRGSPPLHVELNGARSAAAARLVITARDWPIGRVMLVSITPADIFEAIWRETGFGVRDRIRVDDRTSFAFLSDTSAGTTTVAIGMGRGTRGRIQGESEDLVIVRDFGGQTGRERRRLGALTLALEPAREEGGVARAELLFGVGDSEPAAMQAARNGATGPVPPAQPVVLRAVTPAANLSLIVPHLLNAAATHLEWDHMAGFRAIVSSATRPMVSAGDAWRGAALAMLRNDSSAVCGTYRLLRRTAGADGSPREISLRLSRQGRYAASADRAGGDAALALLGYACFRMTREADWIRGEMPALMAAVDRAAAQRDPLAAEAALSVAAIDDDLARRPGQPSLGVGDSLRAAAAAYRRFEPEPRAATVRWSDFTASLNDAVRRDYGRLSSGDSIGGLSLAVAGALLDELGRDLFGIEEMLDGIGIAPSLDGIADDFTWQLENWQHSRNRVSLSYRPADRSLTIRTTAPVRTRVYLAIPWLTGDSCVRSRRGSETDVMRPVMQADGTAYVDLRGHYDLAVVTISAAACS